MVDGCTLLKPGLDVPGVVKVEDVVPEVDEPGTVEELPLVVEEIPLLLEPEPNGVEVVELVVVVRL